MTLRLGLSLADYGSRLPEIIDTVQLADSLGYESVWLGEAYGSDAVSALGYLAATTQRIRLGSGILQMHARTPAMTGMTALTLDRLSSGRFVLGLGLSGPQVVEGWHGVPYGKPLEITREYVDIVRSVVARESPVEYEGSRYSLPYRGEGATGLGGALRSSIRPLRNRIPIFLASIGPQSIRLTGEIADGWLPIFYSPLQEAIFTEELDRGTAKRAPELGDIEIVASPQIAIGPDLDACRDELRPMLALYIGGMGAKGRNFYFDLATRLGYGSAAKRIQEAYLSGRKDEASALVPIGLIDEVGLVGSPERVADQLEAWKQSRVTTICLRTTDPTIIETVANLL